ncbi:MAG: site-specific DNA-methyltransferase [Chloroflexi bacterium]|nr:site-specific DNA-methyltransferase [Chloroflexota bacterium]
MHSTIGLNNTIVGDVLEVLRLLPGPTFDVGVTSPPYNKGERHKGWLVDKVTYANNSDRQDEAAYQAEQIAVLDEIYRVTKPGGAFFYNHKLRWDRGQLLHPYAWVSKTEWVVRQEIIWQRRIAANLRGWRFWQVEERIYWLQKPRFSGDKIGPELAPRHALMTSIRDMWPEQDPSHPAPFPIELPARCILSILDGKPGAVLDPYAGIGTTLVAAKLLGCNYFGIEISPEYAATGKERIANAENERPRLEAEAALHKVEMTFQERKAKGLSRNRFAKQTQRPVAPSLWDTNGNAMTENGNEAS